MRCIYIQHLVFDASIYIQHLVFDAFIVCDTKHGGGKLGRHHSDSDIAA